MRILVVDVARFGNEQTVLTVYARARSMPSVLLPHHATMQQTVDAIQDAAKASGVDAVCIGVTGLGIAVFDAISPPLAAENIPVLVGHVRRGRP